MYVFTFDVVMMRVLPEAQRRRNFYYINSSLASAAAAQSPLPAQVRRRCRCRISLTGYSVTSQAAFLRQPCISSCGEAPLPAVRAASRHGGKPTSPPPACLCVQIARTCSTEWYPRCVTVIGRPSRCPIWVMTDRAENESDKRQRLRAFLRRRRPRK